MLAKLKPLEGKYYGTIIDIAGSEVKVWLTFSGIPGDLSHVPSDRELERAGITREEWNDNASVPADIDLDGVPETMPARDLVEACDHFEDQLSYLTAKLWVEAFNKSELTNV